MPESHSKSEDTQVGVCIYQHQLQNLKTQQMVYVNAGTTFKIREHTTCCM